MSGECGTIAEVLGVTQCGEGVGVMSGQFELRLRGMDVPPGEIGLRDLANISTQLQDLATRLGRWVAGIERVGRSTGDVEDAVALRLTTIRAGSTGLVIERGRAYQPLFDVPLEEEFDALLWETWEAIAADAPRQDTPPLVRQSAVGLLEALGHAAPEAELRRTADGARISFRPGERDKRVWIAPDTTVDESDLTLSGVVKMVDLDSHKFRLVDDVGNRIPLEGVDNSDVARELLDRRADAVGQPRRDSRGRISALVVSSISPADVPVPWTQHVRDDSWREAPISGPDPDGGVEFTDDEWAAFISAMNGA